MDITPGLNPMADIGFMEVMIGPQRQFVLFTRSGKQPCRGIARRRIGQGRLRSCADGCCSREQAIGAL